MRALLLAATATVALLAAPSPAKADLTLGDLSGVIDDLMEFLTEVLLTPAENLPAVFVADPLPLPILGNHVAGLPVTTQATIDLANERLVDRTARVDALNDIGELAAQAAVINSAALDLISVLNLNDPISIAASQQLQTVAEVAEAVASAVESQTQAASAGLDADRAQQEAQEEVERWANLLARNPAGAWSGTRTWATETIYVGY